MDYLLDLIHRFNSDLFARVEGPMTFRFILQPVMALITATIDGFKDARLGRSPYFVRLLHGDRQSTRVQTFREGFTSVARILLLGVGMDVIYQFKVYGAFRYPTETLVISIVLAFIPYQIFRGPMARLATYWRRRHGRS